MRYSLMATLAASALAIGIGFGPAAAFSPNGNTVGDGEGPLVNVRAERGGHAGKGNGGIRSGRGNVSRGNRGRGTAFRSGGRDRRGREGTDFDFFVGPSYGYTSDCEWLRRRAVATGRSYWWRRYRACL